MMGFYRNRIVPRIIELAMDTKVLAKERSKCLEQVSGTVLEVGFGTGHNLPYYPQNVKRVLAVDPSREAARLASKRIAAAPFPVEYTALEGEQLALPDASVDCVVSTYTLCSIGDPIAALRQMRRVLRPGGRFFCLEHGRSPEPSVLRWQQRLNGVANVVLGGCNLDRDIPGLIRSAGFEVESLEQYYVEGDPKFVGYVTRAIAHAAAD
jgi:ubiquinone/menaquinone biosynthesis C-methylase UbiE